MDRTSRPALHGCRYSRYNQNRTSSADPSHISTAYPKTATTLGSGMPHLFSVYWRKSWKMSHRQTNSGKWCHQPARYPEPGQYPNARLVPARPPEAAGMWKNLTHRWERFRNEKHWRNWGYSGQVRRPGRVLPSLGGPEWCWDHQS